VTRLWRRLDGWDRASTALLILAALLTLALFLPRPVAADDDHRAAWEAAARANGHVVNDRRYAEHVIRVVWGVQAGMPGVAEQAIRVVHCETGGRYNHDALGAAGELGWFQHHPIHGHPRHILLDPWENTRLALSLYQRQGWQPWTCARIVGVLR
jgi:hypothetical protein